MRSPLSWPGLIGSLVSRARLAARLVRDPTVPLYTKSLLVLAGLYLVSPVDFIPDVLPLVGQVDDLAILSLALEGFLRICPTSAVTFHRTAIASRRPYTPMPPTSDFIDV